jgi:hypothetical protein
MSIAHLVTHCSDHLQPARLCSLTARSTFAPTPILNASAMKKSSKPSRISVRTANVQHRHARTCGRKDLGNAMLEA